MLDRKKENTPTKRAPFLSHTMSSYTTFLLRNVQGGKGFWVAALWVLLQWGSEGSWFPRTLVDDEFEDKTTSHTGHGKEGSGSHTDEGSSRDGGCWTWRWARISMAAIVCFRDRAWSKSPVVRNRSMDSVSSQYWLEEEASPPPPAHTSCQERRIA